MRQRLSDASVRLRIHTAVAQALQNRTGGGEASGLLGREHQSDRAAQRQPQVCSCRGVRSVLRLAKYLGPSVLPIPKRVKSALIVVSAARRPGVEASSRLKPLPQRCCATFTPRPVSAQRSGGGRKERYGSNCPSVGWGHSPVTKSIRRSSIRSGRDCPVWSGRRASQRRCDRSGARQS